MALMTCRYYSDVLGLTTTATVILPQATRAQPGMANAAIPERLPVLYLLHGRSHDDSSWLRYTSIERYADGLPFAIVMPQMHRSFYTDSAQGYRYWTHLADELPTIMRGFFPLSSRREETFVAGLSMGGYGAFKLALRRPDKFAAAASMSGALDVINDPAEWNPEWDRVFGTRDLARVHGDDLVALVREADPAAMPKLWAWCGTEDRLVSQSRNFRDAAVERGIDLEYSESAGEHDWGAWDQHLPRVLDWLQARLAAGSMGRGQKPTLTR
jgi:putative tributyrin esterase